MAADVVSNPQTLASAESKSARKKKAKAEAALTAVPASNNAASEAGAGASEAGGKANGVDGGHENSYIKELQKSIRGVNKKLQGTGKVDSIRAENPGVSLDDLVAQRKINNDQRAQALKKPALEEQKEQLEAQLAQYKKFDQEYQQKISQEKELLQKSHSDELEKLRDTLKAEAVIEAKKVFKEKFLTLSRFLRAAAARRQLEDDDSDLTKAFEGALLLVYGGDASAVGAAEKLIDGSEEGVPSTEGTLLSVTYAQIKQAALDEAPFAAEEAWVDDVAQAQPTAPETDDTHLAISTDPTIANASLTEISAGDTTIHGAEEAVETTSAPAATSIGAGASNAAADDQWDKQGTGSDDPLAESFEMVPRDPAEVDSPPVPAPVASTQSWADDAEQHAPASAPAPPNGGNDGFHEVQHNRGGRGRGAPFRGPPRGGRGDGRGDGRGRGRGRGDYRGGRGGPRGGGGFRGGPRGGGEVAQ
ncbi:hypothetical protein P154DRAFT_561935 [Amniculicola lignicola CBS 123094]|uniref:YAG7-like dimerisation domain-containing protein n=1 Tax=Amniculicola lignicola CBS 123094 TaxID=1392246 RepID=A0A6A5WLP7_9PLEO|nr:hypothetical protein P154DRAFT_561935 [Amniculicola lignicola CBS 123094]